MQFRTEISVRPSANKIDLKDGIVTIGSCFADEIAQKFMDFKFQVCKNPFGTVYNPISIHKLLKTSLLNGSPSPDGFLERDSISYHYDFHSDWNGKSRDELEQKLRQQILNVREAIIDGKVLIITYGTSWVYEHKESKAIVTNCHKVPQVNFEKFLLTQKRILESFEGLYEDIKKQNSACKILLSVSPVRHIKDTLELNSVSKSILRLTCHTLSESFKDVRYFPAYEIMLDDLRDYRFYEPDLTHPSSVAIDYIWEKFTEAYLSGDAKRFIKEWAGIQAAIDHEAFQPDSNKHQEFLKSTLSKLHQIEHRIDVKKEIEILRNRILPRK